MNAYERVNERLDWIEKKLKGLSDDQWAARNDASKAVSELCNRVEMLEPKDSVAPAPRRYRDVTAEVEEFTGWWHGMRKIMDAPSGYRLRKIVVLNESHRHAFIIEKEEP